MKYTMYTYNVDFSCTCRLSCKIICINQLPTFSCNDTCLSPLGEYFLFCVCSDHHWHFGIPQTQFEHGLQVDTLFLLFHATGALDSFGNTIIGHHFLCVKLEKTCGKVLL